MALTRRAFVALASAVLAACGVAPRPDPEAPSAATQDESEIENKTKNPPALALEPPDSAFTNRNPVFVPPQTLVRRWRVNTVERDTRVDPATWTLTVDGMVERPITLTYQGVLDLAQHRQTTDLHCVEGWGFYDIRWEGTLLSTILDHVGVLPDATHVNFFTFPRIYSDSLTLEQARLPDTMVAHRANDAPLEERHGYPLRLVVPSMYGYKSVKWLDRIELVRGRHLGYWEQRGWRPDPWIR
jgi:sulfoxide reductase catalytic subunit YedY